MRPLPDSKVLAQLITSVTNMMLGIVFHPVTWRPPPGEHHWRTALLPIPGERPLTVGLASDDASCTALCAKMFQCGVEAVDREMVDDSLRELTNMTAGLVKNTLMLDQHLGLPLIVDGGTAIGPIQLPTGQSVMLKADHLALFLWVREGIVEEISCRG